MANRLDTLRLQLVATEMSLRIGQRIRQRREELGIKTQRDLADLIPVPSVTNQTINKWENGAYEPSPRYKAMLAEALDVDVAYFISEPPKSETPDPFPPASGADQVEGVAVEFRGHVGDLEAQLQEILDTTRATLELLRQASDARHAQQDEILQRIEALERAVIANGQDVAADAVGQVRELIRQPDDLRALLERFVDALPRPIPNSPGQRASAPDQREAPQRAKSTAS